MQVPRVEQTILDGFLNIVIPPLGQELARRAVVESHVGAVSLEPGVQVGVLQRGILAPALGPPVPGGSIP